MLGATAWTTGALRAGAAAVAALVVALLVSTLPGQGTPAVAAGPTGTPTGTPTDSGTPTPTPTPTTTPAPDSRLLPDLVAVPATDLEIKEGAEVTRLRFSSSLGNIGLGPIEVRPNQNAPCPVGQHNSTQIVYLDANANTHYEARNDTTFVRHRAGCMIFHPKHDHWHFKASARYTLLDPSGENGFVVVSARRKVSFCLRDTARLPVEYGTWKYRERYGACSRRSPQGISVGWMDVYQSFLAGQALPLPEGLPNGLYCLQTVVDPINQLMETDDSNNSAVRALRIRGKRVVERPVGVCASITANGVPTATPTATPTSTPTPPPPAG
jgi:hypothetical protein